MIETAYKYKPSGQEGPKKDRQYVKPRDELAQAFKQWLDNCPDLHERQYGINYTLESEWVHRAYTDPAQKAIKATDATIAEIETLPMMFETHPKIIDSGYFISAAYNLSEQKNFVFENHNDGLRINNIGYKLEAGKVIVIRANVGSNIGRYSDGIMVNYSKSCTFRGAGNGVIIDYADCHDYGWQRIGHLLLGGATTPDWIKEKFTEKSKKITDDLKDKLAPDRSVEEVLAELEGRDIMQELSNKLRGLWRWH